MHRILLSILVLFMLLASTLVGCECSFSLTILSITEGEVFVMKAGTGNWVEAQVGMTLEPGDVIRTGDGSNAQITFFEGSTIELRAGTEIEVVALGVARDTGSTNIRLEQTIGRTILRVTKMIDPASRYEVETPTGLVAVRGSAVEIYVIEDGTSLITNIAGDIRAIAQGVELQVPEGRQCLIRPDQPPELIYDLAGSWTLYTAPQGGEEEGPYCIDIRQSDNYLYYVDWHKVYATRVHGNLNGDDIVFSGETTYYGNVVSYSAVARIYGNIMRGTYTYTGADNENGDFWATKAVCKMARGWVRVGNIQGEYFLDFWVWDLMDDGISITSATVTGPNIMGTLSLNTDGLTVTGISIGETQPIAGQMYTFNVNYSDGATETTTACVRETFVDLPTHLSPADGEMVNTLTPTFSWQPPPCGCQGYYRVWIVDSRNDDVWSIYLPEETTSVVYNSDGQGRALEPGETYEWRLIAFDEVINGGPDNNVWILSTFTIP